MHQVVTYLIATILLFAFIYTFKRYIYSQIDKKHKERIEELERAASDKKLQQEFEAQELESIKRAEKISNSKLLRIIPLIIHLFLFSLTLFGTITLIDSLFISKDFDSSNHIDRSFITSPIILVLIVFNWGKALIKKNSKR